MAIRSTFTTGEVLTAADLTDTIKGAFINTETTTARTLGTADAGNLVTLNNNSGGTVTIPTNTTWGSPLGTLVHLINIGTAGSFTVGTAAGVTLNAASATLAIQEGGTLIKTATNTWQFVKGGGLGKAQYSSTTGSPTVTTVSGKTCLVYNGSGSITISTAGLCDILVVGGGGGGGVNRAGGGGCGGHLQILNAFLPVGTQTITVGAGGAAAENSGSYASACSGMSSRIGSYFSSGGGNGGNTGNAANDNGDNGASGGGAGAGTTAGGGGSGTTGLGSNGGNRFTTDTSGTAAAGGGGGSSAAGGNGTSGQGGAGGAGTANSITGSSVTRAGGGGGGAWGGTGGAGGSGGGGAGSGSSTAATAGQDNTGGGGGGGGRSGSTLGNAGKGGSGVVIVLIG